MRLISVGPLKWMVGAVLAAAIDGAFLGGVAAIISALGTILLGVLAYVRGHKTGRATEADAWRMLAEERKARLDEHGHDE